MKAPVSHLSRMGSLVSRHAAVLGVASFIVAATTMTARVEGYSHLYHPLALLGAKPLPHATVFNLLAFVVPGLLLAWLAVRLRAALSVTAGSAASPRWSARIGAQLLLLSAIAFALQGLLPLDGSDLDGVRSSRHAAAWMVWWIAFAVGGALLALGTRHEQAWRATARASLLAAIAVPLFALVLPQLMPAGIAQRIAFASWFAWAIHLGHALARRPQP